MILSLVCSSQALAQDMRFTLRERDLRPNLDLHQWIFADGEIVPGTTAAFKEFVRNNPQLIPRATVVLNSPGGSPAEGMLLGDAIRELHYRTNVGALGDAGQMKLLPGRCMSACIYPYLGGEYRYLSADSVIGIHRFAFQEDYGGSVTSEVSQILAGRIVDYIKRSRADSGLFTLMTQASPDDIHILSSDELAKFKVVTGDIYSEDWSFEVHGALSYLKADQITWRGESKLIFTCDQGIPGILTLSELSDREAIIRESTTPILIINDQSFTVPRTFHDQPPTLANGRYVSWSITLTPEVVGALKAANRIGSGLSPAPGIFAGVAGINVGDAKEKLVRFLNDCGDGAPQFATHNLPDITPTEAALAKRVARHFDQQYKKTGMEGIRGSVESCYALARKTPREPTIEYCYILDQLASAVDASTMKQLGYPQDKYWQPQTAVARTAAVLALVHSNPGEYSQILQHWTAIEALSERELASQR
jgi:hypothetical protein